MEIYKGKIIDVKTEDIKFPDGHTSLYEFVQHKPAVAVVPIIDKENILLIKQYRPVICKKIWEIPAGLLDKNEKPLQAARRELEEETGYKAKTLIKLGAFYSSPGFTDEYTTIYLAEDFQKTEQKQDKDEDIKIHIFSIYDLLKKVKNKKIEDSKTVMGIIWAGIYLKIKINL